MSNPESSNIFRTPAADNPLSGTNGNLLISALAGVYSALPDYIPGKFAKRTTRVGLLGAMIAAYAAKEFSPFHDTDGDGESDFKEAIDSVLESSTDTMEADSLNPVATWAIIGTTAAAACGGAMWLDEKIETAVTKRLRKRGVRKPHTVWSLFYAAATFALLQIEDKTAPAADEK